MSALTPEAARTAAEFLARGGRLNSADELREEADRLENAAKTPGQVAEYAFRCAQPSGHASTAKCFEVAAAAVIAHHACLTPWPAGLTADDVELCARYGVGLSAASDDEIMAAGNRVLSALR